jgi:hypothetical protein
MKQVVQGDEQPKDFLKAWLFSSRHGHSTKHQPHFPLPRQSLTQSFDIQAKVECVFSILRVSTFQLRSCDRYQPRTKALIINSCFGNMYSSLVSTLLASLKLTTKLHLNCTSRKPIWGKPYNIPYKLCCGISACFYILLSSWTPMVNTCPCSQHVLIVFPSWGSQVVP